MQPFPEMHELIGFFESEPDVSDRDVPTFYNRLSFVYRHESDVLACAIEPGYGEIDLTWRQNGREMASFALRGVQGLEVHGAPGSESMTVKFLDKDLLDFVLFTKPKLRIEWGNVAD